ncbi:LacI family DNA-binding transcriptional regulator [Pseudoduganella sp. UC29_106]|uniref:LacI family DNA-binding transcriptional regulator n=1 Tax=Pseudoduganella sp. UC29_106 TaxID=3374553 RepID=UPI0037570876
MTIKPPTIHDVAAAAGVSTSTVSKYVNGIQRFSPVVEAALKSAIEALGYRSNPQAQSMITGRTKSIGLSVLDISNPHFTAIVKGANRVALAHGYTLLLADVDETPSRERSLLEALSRRVDGLLVYSRIPEEEMSWMIGLGKPLVFFGRLEHTQLPCVSGDDRRAGYMLAQHLVTKGHKRVAYLGFSRSNRNRERMDGIRECLASHDLSLLVFDCEAPAAVASELASASIMLGQEPPDAIVCYNDLMAIGLMAGIQSLGFRVPQDISVAGFDNIPFGRYTMPPLTTVDQQSERMGEVGMHKLLTAIAGDANCDVTTLAPQLIVRSSVQGRVE